MNNLFKEKLDRAIKSVVSIDFDTCEKTRKYIASLAMPPGSLGKLEDIAVQIAGITGKIKNHIHKKRVLVFSADNGVVKKGVSSAPQSVTLMQSINMTEYKTGMSSIAKYFDCSVQVVDVGIASSYECSKIFNRNILKGTADISEGPAMSKDDCLRAILTGIEFAELAKKDKIDLAGCGEMGIGNTTTSTAVLCALTSSSPEEITCRGGGLTDEALKKKILVIKEALKVNALPEKNSKGLESIVSILSKVGGLDIAAMCGFFIGSAMHKIPVVIDGYISAIAALCAFKMCPKARDYFFTSHLSKEKGYLLAVKEMNLSPYLDLGMRLGEGSGCPLAFNIIEAACAFVSSMADFKNAGIDDSYLEDIRKGGDF